RGSSDCHCRGPQLPPRAKLFFVLVDGCLEHRLTCSHSFWSQVWKQCVELLIVLLELAQHPVHLAKRALDVHMRRVADDRHSDGSCGLSFDERRLRTSSHHRFPVTRI